MYISLILICRVEISLIICINKRNQLNITKKKDNQHRGSKTLFIYNSPRNGTSSTECLSTLK
ncbi:hypothetical protein Scep_024019 [Stephania cephalantha]|uniref:Uncharacterized protein n=1 Tax=Stephania cephalantha TaxID=152367 RepID=A0AAP0HY01_9MAGN